MAFFEYPTKLEVAGPWLIDAKSLVELDNLIDLCIQKMQERRNQVIDSEVTEEMSKLASGDSEEETRNRANQIRQSLEQGYQFQPNLQRRVTVYLTGGRTVEGITFKELISLPNVHEEAARGFAVQATVAETDIKVELGSQRFSGLTANISSNDSGFAQELFGMIQNWVTDIQPKPWQQKWLKSQIMLQMLSIAWFVNSLIIIAVMLAPQAGPSQIKQQARDMAKQGVNSSNQARAMQLLLSIESEYEPEPSPPVRHYPGPRLIISMSLILLALVGLAWPPKGAIGIWKGKRAVERQRLWLKFAVFIPTLILTTVLIPWLLNVLRVPH